MPLVKISVFKGRDAEEKQALHEAVHAALVDAYGIPAEDYNQRLQEYRRGDWIVPPGKSDKYVLVEIFQFAGRTPETKERLYRELVTQLEFLGTPKDEIMILILESPLHNWGIRGGQRADLVDLGFRVDR